jgi:hypothetical protein
VQVSPKSERSVDSPGRDVIQGEIAQGGDRMNLNRLGRDAALQLLFRRPEREMFFLRWPLASSSGRPRLKSHDVRVELWIGTRIGH